MSFNRFCKIGALHLLQKKKEKAMQEHKLRILGWETTLSCNMACKHCFNNSLPKTHPGELTTQEIKQALQQIAHDFDVSTIMLAVTGGEPLLRSDLFEVMEFATKEL
jgi:MoaA/NifB/PqqE/SkfB family radical SAM enzyme